MTSVARRALLTEFLKLRGALRALGVEEALQWVSGSFTDTPVDQNGVPREPSDIDVVTLFGVGPLYEKDPSILEKLAGLQSPHTKAHKIDHYMVYMDRADTGLVAWEVAYWYELWSSRRMPPGTRRGVVQVELSEDDSRLLHLIESGTIFP